LSFSSDLKGELCRLPLSNQHCLVAELAAFFDFAGTLEFNAQEIACSFRTNHAQVARRIYRILKEELGFKAQLFTRRGERLQASQRNYLLQITGAVQITRLLALLQKGEAKDALLPQSSLALIQQDCCRHAYLRGAFIAAGSLSDPRAGDYHLEFISESELHARELGLLLQSSKLKSGITRRKDRYLVYLKNRNAIADFLTRIGGMQHRLRYEDELLQKDLANKANRERNLDNANAIRQSVTGARQAEAIMWLQRHRQLHRLSPALLEVAHARIDDPETSLQEIAEQLSLTKSAVNYRLRRICQIAEDRGWTHLNSG